MTLYYLILGVEALIVLLVSVYLIRKIFNLYRSRQERKKSNF